MLGIGREAPSTKITHRMGVRIRYVSVTGEPSQELVYETDVIEGGGTGDCTLHHAAREHLV